jgi:hypothetical protein
MYKGVDYEGRLAFEGANVKGTGETYNPAQITLFRNDTLFIRFYRRFSVFCKRVKQHGDNLNNIFKGFPAHKLDFI